MVFPAEPSWVPNVAAADAAVRVFRQMVPFASFVSGEGQIEARTTPYVEFVDAGGLFEAIRCPDCHTELTIPWWHEQMDAQYSDTGFHLVPVSTPCCGAVTTLNDLAYEWPMGFARWTISALYPGRDLLTAAELAQLGSALGHPVRQTYRRI